LKRRKGQRGKIELVSWASKDFGNIFTVASSTARSDPEAWLRWTSRTALRNARGGDVCVVLDAPAAPARVADPDPFARARCQ
jgi:hypothetical protein